MITQARFLEWRETQVYFHRRLGKMEEYTKRVIVFYQKSSPHKHIGHTKIIGSSILFGTSQWFLRYLSYGPLVNCFVNNCSCVNYEGRWESLGGSSKLCILLSIVNYSGLHIMSIFSIYHGNFSRKNTIGNAKIVPWVLWNTISNVYIWKD